MKNVNLLPTEPRKVSPAAKTKKPGALLKKVVGTAVVILVGGLLLVAVFLVLKWYQPSLKKAYHRVRPLASEEAVPSSSSSSEAISPGELTAETLYVLQLGPYSSREEAVNLMDRIAALGFSPELQEIAETIELHYVYVGRFIGRIDAEAMARKLSFDKFDAKVTVAADNNYTVEVGRFQDSKDANTTLARLIKRGYPARVEAEETTVANYLINIGEFISAQEAEEKQGLLKENDFVEVEITAIDRE